MDEDYRIVVYSEADRLGLEGDLRSRFLAKALGAWMTVDAFWMVGSGVATVVRVEDDGTALWNFHGEG